METIEIRTEIGVEEQTREVEADVHTGKYEQAVESVASRGYDTFTEVFHGRKDSSTVSDAGLEVG